MTEAMLSCILPEVQGFVKDSMRQVRNEAEQLLIQDSPARAAIANFTIPNFFDKLSNYKQQISWLENKVLLRSAGRN